MALRPAYIPLFTEDVAVRDLVWSLALVVAASQPVGALLYVLDGILIGAGDLRYLAWTMLVALVVFLPLAAVVHLAGAGVVALWWALPVGCWRGWSPWRCATGRAPGSEQDRWHSRQAGFSRWSPPPQRRPRS